MNDSQDKMNDSDVASFLLDNMSPISKKKTLKRAAMAPGFTPIKKKLRVESNVQLRSEHLFTEEDNSVSEFGEKVIAFMLLDDNSFRCPDKDKEEIQYRRDTLEVLHEKFMCEENIDCS